MLLKCKGVQQIKDDGGKTVYEIDGTEWRQVTKGVVNRKM
jgi:hypothetical protein